MAFVAPFSAVTRVQQRANKRLTTARSGGVRARARRATAPLMLVLNAGSTTEMDKILDMADGSLVVVDYSTTWCGPCKKIAPEFERISEEHSDVVFVKVMGDADADSGELMKREGIRAVPAFHFWKHKKKVLEFSGAKVDDLQRNVEKFK